jgi:hypothetical protein
MFGEELDLALGLVGEAQIESDQIQARESLGARSNLAQEEFRVVIGLPERSGPGVILDLPPGVMGEGVENVLVTLGNPPVHRALPMLALIDSSVS